MILVFYGATTFYESELLVEWMGALLNCSALLILHAHPPASARRCAAAGAMLGLSALASAGVLVFSAFVLVWILFQQRHPRRYVHAGAFVLASVVSGQRLFHLLLDAGGVCRCRLRCRYRIGHHRVGRLGRR